MSLKILQANPCVSKQSTTIQHKCIADCSVKTNELLQQNEREKQRSQTWMDQLGVNIYNIFKVSKENICFKLIKSITKKTFA